MKKMLLTCSAVCLACVLAACGGSAPEASTRTVRVVSDPATIGAYDPATVTIRTGEVVAWDFVDLNPHTVSADAGQGGFSSKVSQHGMRYTHRYDHAGTYEYHCAIHPEMHGTVVVE